MAKVAFKLTPNPTFSAKVAIPVHGSGAVDVGFTFKHKTREQLNQIMGKEGPQSDVDLMLEICDGWELDDDYSRENVEMLEQNYMGSIRAIWLAYLELITQKREGN